MSARASARDGTSSAMMGCGLGLMLENYNGDERRVRGWAKSDERRVRGDLVKSDTRGARRTSAPLERADEIRQSLHVMKRTPGREVSHDALGNPRVRECRRSDRDECRAGDEILQRVLRAPD